MGNRLDGRVVIVTGAGRGIGAEVAKWMAADGASVVVNDLGGSLDGTGSAAAPAEVTAQAIRDAGGTAVANFDSVAEYETAGKIVQTAIDNYGRVDAVCHVAGILRDRMVFNMTEAEWDGVLQVHLYGAFNMVRNCVPHMIKQQYGRIVLFSSGSGLGASGQTNYAAAKEGMVGFVRALAKDLAPHGITANAVYPGGATRMTESVPESTTQLRQQQRTQAQPQQGARIPGSADSGTTRSARPREQRPQGSLSVHRGRREHHRTGGRSQRLAGDPVLAASRHAQHP